MGATSGNAGGKGNSQRMAELVCGYELSRCPAPSPEDVARIDRNIRARAPGWGALACPGEGIDVMGLKGRWRIIAMELWDTDAIDLVGPGFIEFDGRRSGRLSSNR